MFKDSKEGRPSYPPVVLCKVLLLQQWYGLSDPLAEEALGDRLSFRRFLGLGLHDAVPDETTIYRFRGRLAEKGLADKLPWELNRHLDGKGLLVKQGTLVDASLVETHSHPPRKGASDPKDPANPFPTFFRKLLTACTTDCQLFANILFNNALPCPAFGIQHTNLNARLMVVEFHKNR